ncbi:phage holin family protein [Mycetocola lacteus]|uniref:Phage holin family protein n=1 Tax=Mycetocola lacteus TaxID=76637 RepID=A0A3L7AHD2_9MICO|nr:MULTISPECIES: phage holin family protein [Mycetocola]MCS4277997.1 putative membrane protein YqjE [Mycetocola sp. BIGb0189]RLP78822.1 phage holin family protein [Mycetocola lacteus]
MSEPSKRSLIGLIADLPGQIVDLIKAEIEQLKVKAIHVGKNAGIGAVFVIVALIFVFFAVGTLVAVIILALALVMPAWLAALIVFVLFLLAAGVFGLLGWRSFKRISDEQGPIEGVRRDIDALKGTGDYDRR